MTERVETQRRRLRVGLVQLTTTDDAAGSVERALDAVARAADAGADLVALPEAVNYMGPLRNKLALAEDLDGPTFTAFAEAAAQHRVVLAAGSLVEKSAHPDRVHNTSVVFGPDGARLGVYRKIHLFDIGDVGDGFVYRESESVAPGDRAVVVDTPVGRLGLSVCFDLRFPELYRALADAGAQILLAPSAFTVPTGRAHWSVLLRARAIETQCFVVAAAQVGQHTSQRVTYGHAMVVGPWGDVRAELSGGPEIIVVEIDLADIDEARGRVPTAANRRGFSGPGAKPA